MQNKCVALVTGAYQGIGLRIAKDLVAHSFTVLVGSRNFERGEAAAKAAGPDAHALQLDVTDQTSITAAAERVGHEFGRLDVLVQNAAISNTSRLPGQSVEEGAREPVRLALLGPDGLTGTFTRWENRIDPVVTQSRAPDRRDRLWI